ncbi:MAG: aminotransferase class I/II-fold pyridoxal phosphate-dependent enzyme [Prevotella sp.]|nr:aminotransferase class I/II-fold pyridoxal phosphate-dependent enzyme [Prevotella sp.]
MQAIILAAGMGRRLGKYTQDNTKCMVEVNGVKLIDRLLSQLSGINLSRIIIVVGYKGDNLKQYITSRYGDSNLNIEFYDNPIYDKTNNIYSLWLVRKQMEEDETLLIESDLIFSDRMIPMIVNDKRPNIALVAKYETWMDGTMVCLDDENHITNFVSKKAFRYKDVDKYYKTVNIYKFSQNFTQNIYVPFLDAYCKALGNNEYYEQVLRVVTMLDNSNLEAIEIGNEKWYEIDDVQDLDIAETIFADSDEMLHRYNMRFGGHWRFPKMLDFCYLVNPYFPPQKMKDELRYSFDTLLTEYPSGMYVNSLLAAKYFGIDQVYTVVGNGAAELIKSMMEHSAGNVGIIYPTFEEYPNRLSKERIVAFVPTSENLSYTADELMAFYADKDIETLLVINPDNPSGNFIQKNDILKLAKWCAERNTRLVVDESFVDFSDNFAENSLLEDDILDNNRNLVVVKSISKSYGVPGLRLGILATADVPLINYIKKDVSIWNINSFAEFYMQIFAKYQSDYTDACNKFIAERRRFEKELQTIPFLEVMPTQANYFFCRIKDKYTAYELTRILLDKFQIMIKDCNNKTTLNGSNFIRISIRDEHDNNCLINALRSL